MRNLINLSKPELIILYRNKAGSLTRVINSLDKEKWKNRNLKLRLTRIRNAIDYLIEHPLSLDTTNRTRKHSRDTHGQLTNETPPTEMEMGQVAT